MIEYLDLFAENNQKYNQCVKILKHLILSEIYYRYHIIKRHKELKFQRTTNDNYVATIPLAEYSIKITLDDFNLHIVKYHDKLDEDDEIQLNLEYREFMSQIFDRDFKYNEDLKEYILRNNQNEKKTVEYLQREIENTKNNINDYNLDENMSNKEYLEKLRGTLEFYNSALYNKNDGDKIL